MIRLLYFTFSSATKIRKTQFAGIRHALPFCVATSGWYSFHRAIHDSSVFQPMEYLFMTFSTRWRCLTLFRIMLFISLLIDWHSFIWNLQFWFTEYGYSVYVLYYSYNTYTVQQSTVVRLLIVVGSLINYILWLK